MYECVIFVFLPRNYENEAVSIFYVAVCHLFMARYGLFSKQISGRIGLYRKV